MNEQQSTTQPLGRRRFLFAAGGAIVAAAPFGNQILAAAPGEENALFGSVPPAPRTQATPEATPTDGPSSSAQPMPDIIAINLLLEPDAVLTEAATALNARLREDNPAGYALDASHAPHISVVQRFVRAHDLDAVSAAVAGVLAVAQPLGWPLQETSYGYVLLAGSAVMFIEIERTAELQRLQEKAIAALAPFTVERGTEASFVPSPNFDPGIIDYVATFVPNVTGEHYAPHLTVGAASEDYVRHLTAEPFHPFTSQVAGVAIYQLGVFGTAAKRLWGWAPSS